MVLNHQIYEDLKNVIGPVATVKLAERFNGQSLYLPRLKEGVIAATGGSQEPQTPSSIRGFVVLLLF